MDKLEKKLGYTYNDISLLRNALTHSSCANESRSPLSSNERLEFLGDSVLGMIVAERLYKQYPTSPEGKMTRMRAELVCEQNLVHVAEELSLGTYLRLGKGEEHSGGRQRQSILADAVEAVLASLYLDGGFSEAERFVDSFIYSPRSVAQDERVQDYKTSLQELVQRSSGQILSYCLVDESGPDHDKRFVSQVLLNNNAIGSGEGKSKKESEQAAAKCALEDLSK